jgi:hypothetical protein
MNMNSKQKTLAALAVAFFLLAPMLLICFANVAAAAPAGNITSTAWDNTTDPNQTNQVQNLGGVNVGDDIWVEVDVSSASGVNGWSVPTIQWNPAVLTCVGASEGNYLYVQSTYHSSTHTTTYEYATSFLVGNLESGGISGGIQDAYNNPTPNAGTFTSPLTSGCLCYIEFTVVGSGSTTVSISGCYLQASSSDTQGTPVGATSATITTAGFVLPEYAYGALAAITASIAAFAIFAASKKGISFPTLSKYIK